MSVLGPGSSFYANAKVKYYYKLTEKEDLDAFVNSIFVSQYQLQQVSYLLYGNKKVVTAPIIPLGPNASIIIDDELEEGLYLVRIKVYNTNSFSVTITPFLNGNTTLTYSIPAKSEYVIYDIFTKQPGNVYYIQIPPNLAILEFSLQRVFEKGNRINIPQLIHTSGNGDIRFRLRRGTYAIKVPYSYTNTTSTTFTNLQFATISTSLGASVSLVLPSVPANGSGSGTFLTYLKITGDYEDVTFSVAYGGGLGVPFTFGLEIEEINEVVENTNFLAQSVTLSGSQVTQSILNVKGSGTHLRLKYASVSGLSSSVTQCQLQATNLNRNTAYSTVWDFIAGGSSTPPSWNIDQINAVQLVANGGSSSSSVTITLLLLYEVVAGELS